jgi:DNA segregation ATPase FtsK/SpoIIIE-like protein
LVGRVTSIEDARVATGLGGSGAERLTGRGDFLAVSGAGLTRFQAAYISPGEMDGMIDRLCAGLRGWDMPDDQPQAIPIDRPAPIKLPAAFDRILHRAQVG